MAGKWTGRCHPLSLGQPLHASSLQATRLTMDDGQPIFRSCLSPFLVSPPPPLCCSPKGDGTPHGSAGVLSPLETILISRYSVGTLPPPKKTGTWLWVPRRGHWYIRACTNAIFVGWHGSKVGVILWYCVWASNL